MFYTTLTRPHPDFPPPLPLLTRRDAPWPRLLHTSLLNCKFGEILYLFSFCIFTPLLARLVRPPSIKPSYDKSPTTTTLSPSLFDTARNHPRSAAARKQPHPLSAPLRIIGPPDIRPIACYHRVANSLLPFSPLRFSFFPLPIPLPPSIIHSTLVLPPSPTPLTHPPTLPLPPRPPPPLISPRQLVQHHLSRSVFSFSGIPRRVFAFATRLWILMYANVFELFRNIFSEIIFGARCVVVVLVVVVVVVIVPFASSSGYDECEA